MSDQVAMESEEIYMKEAALNFLRRNISLAGRGQYLSFLLWNKIEFKFYSGNSSCSDPLVY